MVHGHAEVSKWEPCNVGKALEPASESLSPVTNRLALRCAPSWFIASRRAIFELLVW